MTLTEFRERTAEVFGPTRAVHLVETHHLAGCEGRTAAEAIDAGVSVKRVWLALCEDLDVDDALR